VEVVVPALVDPLLILEKHFVLLSDTRLILVHQQEVPILLQRRHRRRALVHVKPPQLKESTAVVVLDASGLGTAAVGALARGRPHLRAPTKDGARFVPHAAAGRVAGSATPL
jgi:hypothetical protein